MFLAFFVCLFVFFGMCLGNKYDLRKMSINILFGLFFVNLLCSILVSGYSLLSINYHGSSWYFVLMACILGILFMKIADIKYDETDNISICGFTIANTIIFLVSKFSFLLLVINILYYVFIGIYIRSSKSWLSVIIGCLLGVIFGNFSGWMLGYVFSIIVGLVVYFVYSINGIIFKNTDKKYYYGLALGIVVALIGSVL